MASVNKRKWTHNGVEKEAWACRYVDVNGVRRSRNFDLKKDADTFKRKVEREIEDGVHVARAASATVKAITNDYLSTREEMLRDGKLANATVRNDRGRIKLYIVPRFGHMLLVDLKANDIDLWLRDMRAGRTGEPLTNKTVKDISATLAQIIDFARRRKVVATNVVREVKQWPEHRNNPSQVVRTFSVEEVQRLLATAKFRTEAIPFRTSAQFTAPGWSLRGEAMTRCAVYLAAFCGLRRGEVFGLRRDDIDLAKGVIKVRRSMDITGVLKSTKTKSGIRDVPLPAMLADELSQWLSIHYIENEEQVLFTTKRGSYVHHGNFYNHHWYPLLQLAGLADEDDKGRRFHFHALRHFAASMYIAGDIPLPDVATMLGHKTFDTTLQVYTHALMPTAKRHSAIETIVDILATKAKASDATATQEALTY